MDNHNLRSQVDLACRRLLSEQNRDPYTPAYGCFDRRYWGWKLVDFPEATFQRNVYPLALYARLLESDDPAKACLLEEAILAGLLFATQIQHPDGSFDQAFPHEHSFGATAFLLYPLLMAYRFIQEKTSPAQRLSIEGSLRRAAGFLCTHDETHGIIANHLAGATLSLLACADAFQEPAYEQRANTLLYRVLENQSDEGWFWEYDGADPGYQTLCIDYLAQVYRLRPLPELSQALEKAVTFLSWFIHPDGTFGGEYGSRRTAIYYPGGIADLANDFPLAARMAHRMLASFDAGSTVTLADVDIGNLAPVLSSVLRLLHADLPTGTQEEVSLPSESSAICQDFPAAGLFIRGSQRYYAVFGASNGGVLKVFQRPEQRILWNDSGYAGQLDDGTYITTQITHLDYACQATTQCITLETPFYFMLRSIPTPFQFVALRVLNLTLMRNVWLGNLVKSLLVRMLISEKRSVPLTLRRSVEFTAEGIIVRDQITNQKRLHLRWLACGKPFVAIHMASARYFPAFHAHLGDHGTVEVDVSTLQSGGTWQHEVVIS